jgi:hypothetical protein
MRGRGVGFLFSLFYLSYLFFSFSLFLFGEKKQSDLERREGVKTQRGLWTLDLQETRRFLDEQRVYKLTFADKKTKLKSSLFYERKKCVLVLTRNIDYPPK